jgi:hypothetical protein
MSSTPAFRKAVLVTEEDMEKLMQVYNSRGVAIRNAGSRESPDREAADARRRVRKLLRESDDSGDDDAERLYKYNALLNKFLNKRARANLARLQRVYNPPIAAAAPAPVTATLPPPSPLSPKPPGLRRYRSASVGSVGKEEGSDEDDWSTASYRTGSERTSPRPGKFWKKSVDEEIDTETDEDTPSVDTEQSSIGERDDESLPRRRRKVHRRAVKKEEVSESDSSDDNVPLSRLKARGRRQRRDVSETEASESEDGESREGSESIDSTESDGHHGEEETKRSKRHRYRPYEKPRRQFQREKHYRTQARDAFGRFLKTEKTEKQIGDGEEVEGKILDRIAGTDGRTMYLVQVDEGEEPRWLEEKDLKIVD